MNKLENLLIIVLSVSVSSTAHVLLRRGMSQLKFNGPAASSLIGKVWITGTSPWVVSGMFMHVLALAIWLVALRRVDISFAYPFLILGFVLVGVLSYFWLGENVSWWRVVSMAIISMGLLVLAFEPAAETGL